MSTKSIAVAVVALVIFVPLREGFCQEVSTEKNRRPNVVFFIADDISQEDLGCYGHPSVKTPNIDRLAAQGLRFTSAYLTISSCSPSRCSIITGRYPHNTGAPELHTPLPEGQVLFPELLKQAGYYSALSGKHHMGGNANRGFDLVSKGKGPGREEDWVDVLRKRPPDRPFFLWFASVDAHRDWQINNDAPHYKPSEVVVPPYLVDSVATRADLTGYYHEISRFDHYVGAVVRQLEKEGVLDNTFIIIMSDNGRPFPRCKTRLYNSGIKPPFIVYHPSKVKVGVCDSLISSIDIAPTILELAGVEGDERIQGVSFVPLLKDHNATTREVAFAEHNWHVYSAHERMVRSGEWLYIRNNMPHKQNLCVEAYMGGAGEALWSAHAQGTLTPPQQNVFWKPCPPEELYHVDKDPHQLNNVASNPENRNILRQLRGALQKWSTQTGDTLPQNPTPDRDTPPGAAPRPKGRKRLDHGEMPGESSGASQINNPGPVKLRSIL
jgi:N-sulfoglucosamine sulfohydrolase